jgi:hypothetical protein
VPNDHEKADTHKEEEIVPAVMDQTTTSDAVKMTLASDSKQESQRNEDLDPMEGVVNQWEEELDRREHEVEQREEVALGRDKRQYDRWLQLAEWETDLRLTHYAVQQGHARLSKWLKEADAEWTDRVTRVRRMEDEVRFERLRLKDKEDEALFTSRVFEGMRGDYFDSRNFPDRLFTSPDFEGIIPGYPHKSPPL